MAAGATMLDFHTRGRKKSTGAEMRKRQQDQSGGTDAYDLQRAWATYKEVLVIRNGKYWADLIKDRGRGWFVSIDVWYAEIPVAIRCQSNGNIGHTMGVAPETHSDGRWLVSDPLCTGYKWVKPSDLRRAMEAWGKRIGIGSAVNYTTAQEAAIVVVPPPIDPPPVKPPDPPCPDCPDCPECPDCPDVHEIIRARDAEWIAHLTPSYGRVPGAQWDDARWAGDSWN